MAVKEITAAFDPQERVRKLAETARPEVREALAAWETWFTAPAAKAGEELPPADPAVLAGPLDRGRILAELLHPDPERALWHFLRADLAGEAPEWWLDRGHVDRDTAGVLRDLVARWRRQDAWLAQASAWLDAVPAAPADRREDYGRRLEQWAATHQLIATLCQVSPMRLLALLQGLPWPLEETDDAL